MGGSAPPPVAGDPARYLVAGSPATLRPLLSVLEQATGISVVSVARTAGGDPERLVVTMAPARADALATALAGDVVVEPDADLVPFPR